MRQQIVTIIIPIIGFLGGFGATRELATWRAYSDTAANIAGSATSVADLSSASSSKSARTDINEQEKASAALDRGDSADTMRLLRFKADRGDSAAQHKIGLSYARGYFDGTRTVQNYKEAAVWLVIALKYGDESARNDLKEVFRMAPPAGSIFISGGVMHPLSHTIDEFVEVFVAVNRGVSEHQLQQQFILHRYSGEMNRRNLMQIDVAVQRSYDALSTARSQEERAATFKVLASDLRKILYS